MILSLQGQSNFFGYQVLQQKEKCGKNACTHEVRREKKRKKCNKSFFGVAFAPV
jgi:hypothetical protein